MNETSKKTQSLVQQLADYFMAAILDRAAHWEVAFADAPSGEVVSVSDAAHVAARAVLASGLVVPKVMLDVVEAERADYLAQLNQLTSDVLDLAQQWDDRAAELGLAGLGVATQLRALTQQEPR